MEVIIPIGIPGSGKTRLYKKRYSDYVLISYDLIYKEINGDINDCSNPHKHYEETTKRIEDCIKRGKSFYYDFTNVYKNSRKLFSDKFKGKNIKVIYVVLPADVEVSMKRIEEDLKNNVERCNTCKKALYNDLELYNDSLKSNFEGENVQEIIYMKPEDLD